MNGTSVRIKETPELARPSRCVRTQGLVLGIRKASCLAGDAKVTKNWQEKWEGSFKQK